MTNQPSFSNHLSLGQNGRALSVGRLDQTKYGEPPLPTYPYLDQYVEDDVEVATVDEHVGEKSPDLLLLVRVEYEGSLNVGRAVRSHCLGGVSIGQDQHVVDEHTDLEVKNSSSHFFVL